MKYEYIMSERSTVCLRLTCDLCQVYSFLSSKFLGQGTDEHATFPGSWRGSSCHSCCWCWCWCWSGWGRSLENKCAVIKASKLRTDKNYGKTNLSHWCWSRSRSGNICQSSLHIIFEGSDVAFFFHDDAERRSKGNIPSSFRHHDFGQVSLLLHLKTCTQTCDRDAGWVWRTHSVVV